jgi:hypothetical protein
VRARSAAAYPVIAENAGFTAATAVVRSVTRMPSPVDSKMLRYWASRSVSAASTCRRSSRSDASSRRGAASSVRNSCTASVLTAGDEDTRGP